MTIEESIKDFTELHENFASQLKQKGTEKLKEVFKLFWEKNPEVKSISWTQYAPYFNDGDSCEFSVNEVYFSNTDDPEEVDEDSLFEDETSIWKAASWELKWWAKENPDRKIPIDIDSAKNLEDFLHSNAMENIMQMMFGSDNKVIATREGFKTEEYENHD